MRVLTGIDVSFIPFGGSPIVCNDLYSNLPKDIEVRFLTLPPNDSKYYSWWTMEDVVFLNVEKKRDIKEYPDYLKKLKKELSRQIDEYRPDVIHCQHLNYGFSRAIAELNLKIPMIGICHGTDVQLASRSRYFLKNMQIIRKSMSVLIFPTKNMAKDYFKVDKCKKKYKIISHGIPDNIFKKNNPEKRDLNFSNRAIKLLYAGRLNTFKGADIILQAMHYLDGININLTIIGNEDEPGYKSKLLTLVRELNLESKVFFHEQLSRNQLWKTIKEFDIVCFPSRSLEAFSLTTIEAQALGCCVIYAKGGGIENVVGKSGILVEENTPQGWANKIKTVYKSPDTLIRFTEKGYKNAEKYRLSKMQEKYFNLTRTLS